MLLPNLDELAVIMCCGIGSFPTTYLGLPLGAKYKSAVAWNGVIEKVEKRLATWQMQYLSMGGRLTLINSVLDSIPTYIMSLFPMPSKVQKHLDKVGRSFLREGNSDAHKFHLVKWSKVIQPKKQGALGIRDLTKHKNSLLMKWWWRYGQETTSLLKEVVNAEYGKQNHRRTKQNKAAHGVGPWKHINKLKDEFFQDVSFKVGNGNFVSFWKDKWLNSHILKDTHPSIYQIVVDPNSTIAQNRAGNTWDIHFRRNLQDWELGELFDLYRILESTTMNPQVIDKLRWGSSSKGSYSVKEGYNNLCAQKWND